MWTCESTFFLPGRGAWIRAERRDFDSHDAEEATESAFVPPQCGLDPNRAVIAVATYGLPLTWPAHSGKAQLAPLQCTAQVVDGFHQLIPVLHSTRLEGLHVQHRLSGRCYRAFGSGTRVSH